MIEIDLSKLKSVTLNGRNLTNLKEIELNGVTIWTKPSEVEFPFILWEGSMLINTADDPVVIPITTDYSQKINNTTIQIKLVTADFGEIVCEATIELIYGTWIQHQFVAEFMLYEDSIGYGLARVVGTVRWHTGELVITRWEIEEGTWTRPGTPFPYPATLFKVEVLG